MTAANKSFVWAGAVIALVILVALVAYGLNREEEAAIDTQQASEMSEQETPAPVENEADDGVTIDFTDDGYSMRTYTASVGATVTVTNNSSEDMQFSSDNHPTHRDEPALNTSVVGPGESITFTAPSEPGEYGFHDHISSQYTGVLIVE